MRTGSAQKDFHDRPKARPHPRTRARRVWLGVTVALATLGAILTAMEAG
jgi:hypothetical protein